MSPKNNRDCRPAWHFCAREGWINDPNGLLRDESGRWHLFAQYTPGALKPGPMHWLHAVSEDLLHWRELGVALAPDALGEIYSGSAVVSQGKAVAVFTHHGETERQSLAFSEDGVHFEKYPGNPVIDNPGLRDFRDPKVFRNDILGGWSMVVAAGDDLRFYHSRDLLRWEQTGAFGKKENRMGGIFECPDLFPLPAPDGGTLWALTASMGLPASYDGGRMQYFLGAFDGYGFRRTIEAERPLLVEAGQDNYAAVTFYRADPAKHAPPIQIGWANNWAYAGETPTGGWRGCMTLARELCLMKTKEGLRLAARPVSPPLGKSCSVSGGAAPLPGEGFVLDLEAPGDFSAALRNEQGERFAFGCAEGVFFTDRSGTGRLPFPRTSQARLLEGPVRARLIFDRSIAEIFADGGVYANTSLLFPEKRYETVELQGARGHVTAI
ncbi:MAG: glycoside hydrolase family 32 protein [Oscillospiraceae bacterium]|nr:glycoside hydrolase family 32 protein [Oscillospiraceae bacterium]